MITGAVVTLIPILMIGGFVAQRVFNIRLSQFRSTESMIDTLAKNPSHSTAWQELTDRHFKQRFSDAEISRIVEHVIAGVAGSELHALVPATDFLTMLIAEDRISDEQFSRLCAAYYSNRITINMPSTVRSGSEVTFNTRGWPRDLPGSKQICALRDVRIGDRSLQLVDSEHRRSGLRPSKLSCVSPWGINGKLVVDVAPGTHEVQFTFDVGAINDLTNPFDAGSPPDPAENWPATIYKSSEVVKVQCTVVGSDESPIKLIAPAEHRDAIVSSLRVTALRITTEGSRIRAELVFNPTADVPIPCSFTVFVRSEEVEEKIGSCRLGNGGVGKSGFTVQGRSIESDTVDVIFRPDLKAVEGRVNWPEMWGKEIVVPNVPVQRGASIKELNRQALQAALAVNEIRLGWREKERVHGPALGWARGELPIDVRFRIFIHSGEFEHELGTMSGGPDSPTQMVIPLEPVEGFPQDAQTADVVFRPFLDGLSPRQKREHFDEEIVIKDVPVVRPE